MTTLFALFCCCVSPVFAIFLAPELRFVTVQTPVGNIRGISKLINGKTINEFYGIPYAEPPTGSLRFNKPVQKVPFISTFDATDLLATVACPSWEKRDLVPFSEDCLMLNIFSPPPSNALKPVMIWIHGGGFTSGSNARYDGSIIAGSDVIVVAINYRLGQLGFMSTESGLIKGNFGLWDQHMAIQWVHDNIESFGGDVNNVTIFGESAGSSSVMYQSMYAGNKGLFQRVIAESGSTTSPWAYKNIMTSSLHAYRFAYQCGCKQTTEDARLACLRLMTSSAIITCVSTYAYGLSNDDYAWTVTADGEFVATDQWNMFTDSAATHADLTFFQSLDLLIGVNKGDGMLYLYDWNKRFNTNMTANPGLTKQQFHDTILPIYLKFGKNFNAVNASFLEKVFSFYSADDTLVMLRNLVQFTTDVGFIAPSVLALMAHERQGTGSSFFYEFAYSPHRHQLPVIPKIDDGTLANHADELDFVFGAAEFYNSTVEQNLSKTMVTMLTNFAKTG